jgi:reverse gyrase
MSVTVLYHVACPVCGGPATLTRLIIREPNGDLLRTDNVAFNCAQTTVHDTLTNDLIEETFPRDRPL